jgi:hypothetical protein
LVIQYKIYNHKELRGYCVFRQGDRNSLVDKKR